SAATRRCVAVCDGRGFIRLFQLGKETLMRRLVGLLLGFMVVLAQPRGAQAQQVPPALVDVGEFGENINDLAKAKDWPKVGQKMTALKAAATKLAGNLKGADAAHNRLK